MAFEAVTTIGQCLEQQTFSGFFSCLGNTEIAFFLIPFLLIFGIIYAVLKNIEMFDSKTSALISIALSLLVSFQVSTLFQLKQVFSLLSGPIVWGLVALLITWLFVYFITEPMKEKPTGDTFKKGHLWFILFIVILFFVAMGMGVIPSFAGGGAGTGAVLSENMMLVIVGVIIVLVIAWVLSGGESGGSGGESE